MTSAQLKAWRAHWLMSQMMLAGLLDVSNETISRWERGTVPIPTWLPLALETLARRRAADLANRATSIAASSAS
jgi:DNA-binding transcriptional regulator YiaG